MYRQLMSKQSPALAMATPNGPPSSILTFLTSLPTHPQGTKVRFLGCVTRYNDRDGILELQHAYPLTAKPVLALVDVNVVLETTARSELEVGAWVNIIGYVANEAVESQGREREKRPGRGTLKERGHVEDLMRVPIDATSVWGTGPLRIAEYEQAVEGRVCTYPECMI